MMSPYERLLGDALEGDQWLFARQDAIEAQWAIVEPVRGTLSPISVYEPNTWDSVEAAQRLDNDRIEQDLRWVFGPGCAQNSKIVND
jgi:glucose-6-phosphate 1-dehydrogenase